MQIRTCEAASLPKLMEEMHRRFGEDVVLLSVRRIEATRTTPQRIEGTICCPHESEAPATPFVRPNVAPRKVEPREPAPPSRPVERADSFGKMRSVKFDTNRILRGSILVGPPGSGKTTTAAKIAGRAAGMTKASVGMISTDTSRPGGAALMMAYAEKAAVYATSVDSASDLQRRTTQWNRRGPLVIDTCGFSPRKRSSINELKMWLDNVDGDLCRLLTISATESLTVVRECLELYDTLQIGGVVVTKTDLDASNGECVEEVKRQRRPLAFLGTGTEVPGDLEVYSDGGRRMEAMCV